MGTPYLGEIKIISWNYAPKGWAFCNGQTLPINQNQALFALLGTTYGGNGSTTFLLPNLQGRTAIHFGNGFTQGQNSGEQSHTLSISEMPQHTHAAKGSSNAPDAPSPAGNYWSAGGNQIYADTANATMNAAAITTIGGSQPHENMPPYLVLNYIIALQGIFPSRN